MRDRDVFVKVEKCYSEYRNDEVLIAVEGESRITILSGTAVDLWKLLVSPKSIEEMVSFLYKHYKVEKDEAREDVKSFLKKGIKTGIIREEK